MRVITTILERPIGRRLPSWLLASFISIAIRIFIRGMPPARVAQARAAGLAALGECWRSYIEEQVGRGIDPTDEVMGTIQNLFKRCFGGTLGLTADILRQVIEMEVALAQRRLKENGGG